MPDAITWTNVALSSVSSSDIYPRAISQETPQPSITKFSLKILHLKLYKNISEANKLMSINGPITIDP